MSRFRTAALLTPKQRLTADPLLKGQSIKVYSFQGDVKLDGVVQTEQQREQAAKLAWGVPGVRSVENNILLTSER
jgi:osmotically-inducible protein OsmY